MSSRISGRSRRRSSGALVAVLFAASACGTSAPSEPGESAVAVAPAQELLATTEPLDAPAESAPAETEAESADETATAVPPTAVPPTAAPEDVEPEDAAPEDADPQQEEPEPAPAEPEAESEPEAEAEPEATAAPAAPTVALPAVDVVDLLTGETASLASFSSPGATLLWFWAPH